MVCCIAALAVMAAIGKVFRRPTSWIRGGDGRPGTGSGTAMPPPGRYVTPAVERPVAAR